MLKCFIQQIYALPLSLHFKIWMRVEEEISTMHSWSVLTTEPLVACTNSYSNLWWTLVGSYAQRLAMLAENFRDLLLLRTKLQNRKPKGTKELIQKQNVCTILTVICKDFTLVRWQYSNFLTGRLNRISHVFH